MTTTPEPTDSEPADEVQPAPGGIRAWFSHRFGTPAAVYGLIVFTAFIAIADDHADDVWDLLLTVLATQIVFFIAHVFAHTVASRTPRTWPALREAIIHGSGMLYAAVPTTIVLVAAGVDETSVAVAVDWALLVAIVTLGILGFAASFHGRRHVFLRLLWAVGTAALGILIVLLELAVH